MARSQRNGFTLIELLIIVAIIAIALGLLVVAIMRVREVAARTQSSNNLKQIILAVHHFADSQNGRLPIVGDIIPTSPEPGSYLPNIPKPALFSRILPYIEQPLAPRKGPRQIIPLYVSPADPTSHLGLAKGGAVTSYAANGQVFINNPRLQVTFGDGISNTIAFAEHYSVCNGIPFYYSASAPGGYRATFADYSQYAPVTSGTPPVSLVKNYPQLTFQVTPNLNRCSPSMAQTPHSSGMLTAIADGSVRTIAPNIAPTTFWAAVTPAGGELLGSDW